MYMLTFSKCIIEGALKGNLVWTVIVFSFLLSHRVYPHYSLPFSPLLTTYLSSFPDTPLLLHLPSENTRTPRDFN